MLYIYSAEFVRREYYWYYCASDITWSCIKQAKMILKDENFWNLFCVSQKSHFIRHVQINIDKQNVRVMLYRNSFKAVFSCSVPGWRVLFNVKQTQMSSYFPKHKSWYLIVKVLA